MRKQKKIRTIKLTWYTDPGHSWLRVSYRDIQFLGLNKPGTISHFSYQSPKGTYWYLEEDNDARVLLDAIQSRTDCLPQFSIDRHASHQSVVRHYRSIPFYDVVYYANHSLVQRIESTARFIQTYLIRDYAIPTRESIAALSYTFALDMLDLLIDTIKNRAFAFSLICDQVTGDCLATNDLVLIQTYANHTVEKIAMAFKDQANNSTESVHRLGYLGQFTVTK